MTTTGYRNIRTGRELYERQDGYEPNFPYEADEDGNWVRAESNTTMAEQISARYDDDGQCWTDAQGIHLEAALRDAFARAELRPGTTDVTRWTLGDGSVITTAGDGWDYGYPDCWCWRGAGHAEHCTARAR